jgi:hypothetical protein
MVLSESEHIPSRCPVCGEVVGAYEPAISETADGDRLPGNRHGRDVAVVAVFHRDCLEPAER